MAARHRGQYHGAGVFTGFGLRFRHLAQRYRLPFTAALGRCRLPVLGMFLGMDSAPQHEHGLHILGRELFDVVRSRLQDFSDLPRRHVAEAHLDHLRGMTTNECPGQKIVVFRDDRESFVLRKSPYSFVIFAREPHIPNVATRGKTRHKNIDEAERQVLINQRFHATDLTGLDFLYQAI